MVRAILDGAQADCRAGVCFHAVHLHRLCSGADAVRRGEISVHAAGDGGRVRHADVLPADPNHRADAGSLHAASGDGSVPGGRRRRGNRHREGVTGASTRRSSKRFERIRARYRGLLDLGAERTASSVADALLCFRARCHSACRAIGQDFFPYVDAGQMRLHVRTPTGTRIEEAERIFAADRSRRFAGSFPPRELRIHSRQHRTSQLWNQPGLQRQRPPVAMETAKF